MTLVAVGRWLSCEWLLGRDLAWPALPLPITPAGVFSRWTLALDVDSELKVEEGKGGIGVSRGKEKERSG
jgi:hypothetical protein